MITGYSWIGGRRGAGGGESWQARNPATGDCLEPIFHSEQSVDAAVACADAAFSEYSAVSDASRAVFLRTIATHLRAAEVALVERVGLETALPPDRVRGEMARTCHQLELFASAIEDGSWRQRSEDAAEPGRQPQPKPRLVSERRPLGPVAVFCASNFPLAYSVIGGDTASALAVGCPVVVMAHWAHPGTAGIVAQAVRAAVDECGMPEGVFSMLYGRGNELGGQLVAHPAIRAVGFTGSRRGGRALMDIAAARAEPIPVYAEMSAINPIFFQRGATGDDAMLDGLVASLTGGIGQFCTNPGLLVCLAGRDEEALTDGLRARLKDAEPGVMLHRGIWENYAEGVARMEKLARDVVRHPLSDGRGCQQVFACDAETFLADKALHEEVFGPSTLIVVCRDEDAMLAVARGLEGQLTASIHGEATDFSRRLVAVLETKAGRLVWNGFPTGVEVCASMVHGGPYPATSDGRSTAVGPYAMDRFTRRVCWQGEGWWI
ncbi:aldehyde dehydrogenase (NADP(+)) [Sulfuriroseicoccus oceanibius]|uniref:Aldehyde dehydrogenase (NADP(+)) n=1 Tax=Sulfuriroseicoccus oceanibius TaxID=2707525 RepID=A0A6B3L7Q5_9BACT|nr:aldehyde dehydrogenase (NADP(+)) [Sulfuriroseicoccus oceanibius]QQL45427.1 aldehyde dehydrogenase (NADP(+)) [Sulfuriroseicoccus oceanibius]